MTFTSGLERLTAEKNDVFTVMRPDLERVQDRVLGVARVDFPAAAELVTEIVKAGGKRLRPLLLLLSGRAFEYAEQFDRLVTAAAGVELLHTASLIHDDTVDRAALRRGKPTLNSVLSSGAVILIGDYLFAQSAMLAAATDIVRVVSVFASTLGDICDGQLREVFSAHRLDQSREEYEKRIFGKTASLFAGSAEMGAIIGNAPEDHIQALRAYGSNLGMAFQVIDDLLDVVGGTEELGKPAGNDLRQGTVTLPTLFYIRQLSANSPEFQDLKGMIAGDNADPLAADVIAERVRASGAIDQTFEVAEQFVERAKSSLDLLPDPETAALLSELADFAVRRLS
jgi:geranylgeranyl pyrophosphate synthase